MIWMLVLCTFSSVKGQQPILHLPMAGTADDISAFQQHGKIFGGVTPAEDRFGNPCGALYFNGVNGYISIPHSEKLNSIRQQFSLSTWIKLDEDTRDPNFRWLTLICKGENPEELDDMPHYRVQVFQGNTQSTVSINTELTEYDKDFKKHNLQYHQWYHIVLTYDGHQIKFYINADLVWEFDYQGVLKSNDAAVNIGRDIPGATEFYKGAMSDMRLFDVALDRNTIQNIYKKSTSYGAKDILSYTCPEDEIWIAEPGKCYANGVLPEPTANNLCGRVLMEQVKGPESGNQLKVGAHLISYKMSNGIDAAKYCDFTIHVKDQEAPILQAMQDTTIYHTAENTSLKYIYSLPKATDNCAIKSVDLVEGLKSGKTFPKGTTTLKFKAIDIHGNETFGSYQVHVVPNLEDDGQFVEVETPVMSDDDFEKELEKIPLVPGSKMDIENLIFKADSYTLNREAQQKLNVVKTFMKRYPNVVIEIGGHTNGIPTTAYCDRLSTQRAKACYEYLIKKGVPKNRLTYVGYGKRHLRFPADYRNPKNQRVELTILEVK